MLESVKEGKLLPDIVADEITKFIIQSKLQAGEKLPSELELSKKLNVGRSTIREAIKILTSKNIVEIKRGLGTFVAEKTGMVQDPLGFAFIPDKLKLLQDILDLRYMIEPKVASMAAKMATQSEINEMSQLCDNIEAQILAGEDHLENDIAFHTLIAKSTQNLVITNLLPIINGAIQIFMEVTNSALKQETIQTHRQVLEAIKVHDQQKAFDSMERHIRYNQELIEKLHGE